MNERWKQYRDLPYSVSEWGTVRNDITGRVLAPSTNKHGLLYVRLIVDGQGFIRSLAKLVAEVWAADEPEHFNTVLHLDGNLHNCFADNLTWRPRAYVIQYNKQFRSLSKNKARFEKVVAPFIELTSQRVEAFVCLAEAGQVFGILDEDISANLSANALNKHYNRDPEPIDPFGRVFVYL